MAYTNHLQKHGHDPRMIINQDEAFYLHMRAMTLETRRMEEEDSSEA